MTLLAYAEWRPDVADYESQYSKTLVNVIPRGDGYGPFPDLVALSGALPSWARGGFRAINTDGTVTTFAATSTKLYQLNATTLAWTDVSSGGGSYAPLNSTDNWQFAQFASLVFATQANAPLQVFNLISPATFTAAGGSPPQARYITVVGGFLVLSGLSSLPFRVQWSGLYDVTSSQAWTAGINSSSYQDIADGGIVRGVAGGDFGLIMQDSVLRTMTYLPGSPVIFQIERTAYDVGLYAPYSLIVTKNRIFFYSSAGFQGMQLTDSAPTPIGKERVDRTFAATLDTGNLQLFMGASDPQSSRVFWAYKSTTGTANQFDTIIGYDWALDRWFQISTSGEYLLPVSPPALTLESLDAIDSDLETFPVSFDSYPLAYLPQLAAFNTGHALGFYNGSNLEAKIDTGEQDGQGRRLFVRGFRPITDAASVYGSVSYRETQNAAATYGSESAINSIGNCDIRQDARYLRGRVRIPYGTTWTFARGIEPDVVPVGMK